MQAVLIKDLFQFFACLAVQFGIRIFYGIKQEGKGHNVKSRIKGRVNQVAVHGNLYRISIDQCLDTFGLVSVGQLICGIYVDFDLAAGCFFDQFSELPAAFCPGTGFCRGAGEVPSLLRPVEIASVFYIICACRRSIFLCKDFDQVFCIIISLAFQLVLIPRIHTVYRLFKGIDVHIFVFCDLDTVLVLPAVHDLIVTGTVDRTFVIDGFLSGLIDNFLLFRSQIVIDISVNAEEQAVINRIPHRAVRLYFLYAGCVDSRQRILLAFYGFLLQGGVGLGPVHVGRIGAPAFVALHQQVTSCDTDFQVFHVIDSFDFLLAVGQLAETVLGDSHTVQAVLIEDCF